MLVGGRFIAGLASTWVGLSFLISGLVLPPEKLFAAGVVSSPTESALDAAMAGGGTVTFSFDGTIFISRTIGISNNTVLNGTGHSVVLSGSKTVPIFVINPDTSVTLRNLNFTEGVRQFTDSNLGFIGGGAVANQGTLLAVHCAFSSNAVYGFPGMAIGDFWFPPLRGYGGAIANGSSGNMTLVQCGFFGNVVTGGGGVNGQNVNAATGSAGLGGAIFNDSGGMTIISECVFSNNMAFGGFGRDYVTFAGATGEPGGSGIGGAIASYGELNLSDSAFASNRATGGNSGGLLGRDPRPGATGAAGALGILGGSSVSVNCTFWSNSATGGVGTEVGGDGLGGAICSLGGSAFLTNDTFAWNFVIGGLFSENLGRAGSPKGSAIGAAGGSTTLKNSILAAAAFGDTNVFGAIADAGYNLNSERFSGLTNTSSLNGMDPKLAPPGNNGGPTPTIALLSGSPAIDSADPNFFPATDQRGNPRPFGPAPDIGSFELLYEAPLVPAVFLSNPIAANRQFQALVTGASNQTYSVRRASLVGGPWTRIFPIKTGLSGTAPLLDTNPPLVGAFYSISWP